MTRNKKTSFTLLRIFILFFLLSSKPAVSFAGTDDYYFFDRIGDVLLVSRGNDIYIQNINGTQSTRITDSVDAFENDAFFSQDGRYVFFKIDGTKHFGSIVDVKIEYFMQPLEGDKKSRIEITEDLYRDYKKERLSDRYFHHGYLDIPGGEKAKYAPLEKSLISEQAEEKDKEERQ